MSLPFDTSNSPKVPTTHGRFGSVPTLGRAGVAGWVHFARPSDGTIRHEWDGNLDVELERSGRGEVKPGPELARSAVARQTYGFGQVAAKPSRNAPCGAVPGPMQDAATNGQDSVRSRTPPRPNQEDFQVIRSTHGWTGLATAVFAFGLAGGPAQASAISTTSTPSTVITSPETPILSYDTVGSSISNTNVTGTPGITFVPASGGSFLAPSSLSLGSFMASALPDGQTTTYANTPFSLAFNADGINGSPVTPNETPVTISGVLNGTLTGSNQSSVVATFNSIDKPTFQTGLYSNSLGVPSSSMLVVPSTSNGGMSSIQASFTTTATGAPVPEPSTVVIFSATIVGLGLWRRRRS